MLFPIKKTWVSTRGCTDAAIATAFILEDELNLCYLDTETGGLDPHKGAEMIELAAILLNGDTLEEKSRFGPRSMGVMDPLNLNPKALAVNGKTVEEVMAAEDPKLVLAEFAAWMLDHNLGKKVVPVAHNAKFDIAFLKKAFETHLPTVSYEDFFDYHDLCTAGLFYFHKVLLERAEKRSGLKYAAEHFEIVNNGAHMAMGDAETGVRVLRALWREQKERLAVFNTVAAS